MENDVEPIDLETLPVDDSVVEVRTVETLVADYGDVALRLADGREELASHALARTYRDWRRREVVDIEERIALEISATARTEATTTSSDLLTRVEQLVQSDRDRRVHKRIWTGVVLIAVAVGFAPLLGTRAGPASARANIKTPPIVYPLPKVPRFFLATSFVDQQHGFALAEVQPSDADVWSPEPRDVWFLTSVDGGRTWKYTGPRLVGAADVAFTDLQHGVVASEGHGARYTNDGGQHWTQTRDVVGSFSTAGGVVWANAGKQILRSTDTGRTWVSTSWASNPLELHAASANTAYALQETALGVTEDAGVTWQQRRTPCSGSQHVGTMAASADVVWITCLGAPDLPAGVTEGPDWNFTGRRSPPFGRLSVFQSGDGGRSWHRVSTPLNGTVAVFRITVSSPQEALLWGGSDVFSTSDGGRTWKQSGPLGVDALLLAGYTARFIDDVAAPPVTLLVTK